MSRMERILNDRALLLDPAPKPVSRTTLVLLLPPESPFVPIAPHSEQASRSSEASRARGIRDPVWEK
ncbi:hypothetical protein HN011_010918, partial [Eciton burchellii]